MRVYHGEVNISKIIVINYIIFLNFKFFFYYRFIVIFISNIRYKPDITDEFLLQFLETQT